MTTLTITLPDVSPQRVREHARKEGFRNPNDWMRFLIERRIVDTRKQQNIDVVKKFAMLRANTKAANLSSSEAKAMKQGRAAIKRGEYVTLDQLTHELGSQHRKTSSKKAGAPSS